MTSSTRTSDTTGHNNSRTLKNNQKLSVQKPGITLQVATISFTATDTIADSGNGLAVFLPGTTIRVSGDTANARDYNVRTSAAGSLTVHPLFITTEGAGNLIKIEQVS